MMNSLTRRLITRLGYVTCNTNTRIQQRCLSASLREIAGLRPTYNCVIRLIPTKTNLQLHQYLATTKNAPKTTTKNTSENRRKDRKTVQRTDKPNSELSTLQDKADPDVLYSNIQVEVRGHDPSVLNSYNFFTREAANLLNIVNSEFCPPRIIDRRTLVKSRHNYGKYHKVQYEARTHFRVRNLEMLTGSTADTYLEYIQRNLPEGMAMKVTKTRIQQLPEHIKRPEEDKSDSGSQ